MDYRKSAQEVLDNIGGAGNVVSAAHCATRLRLVIADNAKVDKEALENIDGAKGVFEAQGQLQIILALAPSTRSTTSSLRSAASRLPPRPRSRRLRRSSRTSLCVPLRCSATSLFPSSPPSWLRACCWAL
ncbi:MAG: PTS glucose/sucrose transporter subunit IIB [Collinsella sp.]